MENQSNENLDWLGLSLATTSQKESANRGSVCRKAEEQKAGAEESGHSGRRLVVIPKSR